MHTNLTTERAHCLSLEWADHESKVEREERETVWLSQCMTYKMVGAESEQADFKCEEVVLLAQRHTFFLTKENYGTHSRFVPCEPIYKHIHTHTAPTPPPPSPHTHLPHLCTPTLTGYHSLFHTCTHLLMQVAESTPLIYTKAGPLTDPYTAPRA